jgi:hypothetical protein
MKKVLFCTVAIVSLTTLNACGGGGGAATTGSGFQQTYVSSAAQGELISYSVDTTNLTYNWQVVKSQYGCEIVSSACNNGSGTLMKNSDNSYTLTGTTSKIYMLQSGLLTGTIKLGTMPATPILGIPNPISTSATLAGTYNYISAQCAQKTQGMMTGCHGLYGSLSVVDSGSNTVTYSTCESDDIENSAKTCTSTTSGIGVYDSALKSWKFSRNGSANENYMVAFTSSDGKKIAYIDFNDAGGYGYGQATLSQKYTLQASDLVAGAGDWFFVNLTPGQDSVTWIDTVDQHGVVSSNGGTLTLNTPWNGFAKNSLDARGVMIASGKDVITFGGYTNTSGDAKYVFATKISR